MSADSQIVLWCVVQVTLVALLGTLAHAALRTRAAELRSAVALGSLAAVVLVTALSLSPWPNWTRSIWRPERPAAASVALSSPASENIAADSPTNRRSLETDSVLTAAWAGFREALLSPTAVEPPAAVESRWSGWRLAAIAAFGLIGIGVLRTLGGWLAVLRLRRSSRRLEDRGLSELMDVLQAELGCVGRIDVAQTDRLGTPATVGWRRPVILLPTGWRKWSPSELRAVLAHELAHIRNRDYAAWLLAQGSLVIHFYHPLVHWLASRLRLDQELAADAAAAPLAGGRQSYLETLAQLALREADRPVGWPVRAFAPTHRTFLRRLEMLRDPRQFLIRTPARVRTASLALLLLAGLAISGLRGPGAIGPQSALAADPPQSTAAPATRPAATMSLDWVPRDTWAVIGVRPQRLLSQAAFRPIAEALTEAQGDDGPKIPYDQIDSVAIVILQNFSAQTGLPASERPGFIIRTAAEGQAQAIADALLPRATPSEFDGRTIHTVNPTQPLPGRAYGFGGRSAYAVIDSKTLILVEDEAVLRRMLISGPRGSAAPELQNIWQQVSGHDLFVAGQLTSFRDILARNPLPVEIATVGPLLMSTRAAGLGLTLSEQLLLQGLALADDAQSAKIVQQTLEALVTLGRNALSVHRSHASRASAEESAMVLRLTNLGDAFLDRFRITTQDALVSATSMANAGELPMLTATLLPAIRNARGAAQDAQEKNNLKQILLALHNYYDVYGHFPPSSVLGPDGKTPHSWRVAILPFIDQSDLYNEYRKDQPWDSENNLKVLAKMPAVYRSPKAAPESRNASYFGFVGSRTILGVTTGVQMSQITDGTSNTIAIVGAVREIPWTKPEDIPFEPGQPLPEIGRPGAAGVVIGQADGSVLTMRLPLDPVQFQNRILRDDGNVIRD